MIDEILPEAIASYALVGQSETDPLYPEEEALLTRAVPKRVREFKAGRHCARKSLGALGIGPSAILPGPNREPIWPCGIVGSITHCDGYCAAAVAYAKEYKGIGIDAEIDGPMPRGVIDIIADDSQQKRLFELPKGINWDRLLFSAKESVFKLQFPITREPLDMIDILIEFNPESNGFLTVLRRHPVLSDTLNTTKIRGNFLIRDGLIVTTAWIQ